MTKEEVLKIVKNIEPSLVLIVKSILRRGTDEKYQIEIKFSLGGGSWCTVVTDTTTKIVIQVDVSERLIEGNPGYQELKKVLDRLNIEINEALIVNELMGHAFHEIGHAIFTRPGNVVAEVSATFNHPNPKPSLLDKKEFQMFAEKSIHLILNAVEDPRIENLMKLAFVVATYIDMNRIIDYEAAEEADKAPEIFKFAYSLLTLAIIGRYPKFTISDEAKEAIEAIINHPIPGTKRTKNVLDEFVCEPNCRIANHKFKNMIMIPKVHDYIEKVLQDDYEEYKKNQKAWDEFLSSLDSAVTVNGKSNAGGNGLSVKLPKNITVKKIAESDDDENEGSGSSSSNGSSNDQTDEEKSSNGSNSSDEGSEDKADGSEGNNSTANDSSEGEGNEQSSASEKPSRSRSNKSVESPTFDKDGKWQLNGSDSDSDDEAEELKEDDDLKKRLDECIAEIVVTAEKITQVAAKIEKVNKKATAKTVEDNKIVIDTSFVPDRTAPQKVVATATPLRNLLKKLLENQEDELEGTINGVLDTRRLHHLPLKECDVFKKNRLPEFETAAYYICWDGSGSMYGEKQSQSGFACAVIEEAVRGLYPLKIINFTTRGNVVHYVVKDFNDKSKKNHSYSYATKRSFSGGNKDGWSIRHCAEELAKRPETNKFLIVLSDGAPSDYDSHAEAIADVKAAVNEARAKNIDVMSIFFGEQYEREREIESYNKMYGSAHMISCDPGAIVKNMCEIVKRNIRK